MTFRLPLSALLSQVLTAFTTEFEQEVAAAGYPELSLALGSNVLRFLDEEGLRVGTIAELAGVSKQAISQQIGYLERHGYVAVEPDPEDNRAKLVRLTPLGAETRDVCRPLFRTIEQRWRRRYGRDNVRALREALEALAGQLDSRLPHYPPDRTTGTSVRDASKGT
jgi:DNA-binding MarR family transcriptional regulator